MSEMHRHNRMMMILPKDTTIYCVGKRGSTGTITTAAFFYIKDDKPENITSQIATVSGSRWNNKTGLLYSKAVRDVVDLCGIRLHNQGNYFRFEMLVTI